MRVACLLTLLLLSGCSSSPSASPDDADADDSDAVPETVLRYANVTVDSSNYDLEAIPFMVGGPVGPGAILHEWAERPQGFQQLDLRLTWVCAHCSDVILMTFGVQDTGLAPNEEYRYSTTGSLDLELTVTPDMWTGGGIQASMVPSTEDTPVTPMLLVSFEMTAVLTYLEPADDTGDDTVQT